MFFSISCQLKCFSETIKSSITQASLPDKAPLPASSFFLVVGEARRNTVPPSILVTSTTLYIDNLWTANTYSPLHTFQKLCATSQTLTKPVLASPLLFKSLQPGFLFPLRTRHLFDTHLAVSSRPPVSQAPGSSPKPPSKLGRSFLRVNRSIIICQY